MSYDEQQKQDQADAEEEEAERKVSNYFQAILTLSQLVYCLLTDLISCLSKDISYNEKLWSI